jgi:aminoglycoside phosphotransferase family enzyme/predicted kinase
MQSRTESEFAARLRALARSEAFPFPLRPGETIVEIQTHASAVLLAGDCAYKLKKPRDFGFFDYTTAEQRRHFCIEEVRLNTRLAPDVYLGVAPVLRDADGSLRFGPARNLDQVPEPGSSADDGQVVDYAVVMRRLPEEATLAARVAADSATPELLAMVARRVATFHAESPTNTHIASFGSLDVVAGNWEENFAQMRPYVGRVLDAVTYDRIVAYVHGFLGHRAALFKRRQQDGRIRDCHGDLRLQHVYALGGQPAGASNPDQIAIVDCIEFNERFRYSDVAAEVAFLAMELDAAARPDLTRAFVGAYVEASGDEELRELLPFYACYRACVRGKVLAFQLDEPEVPAEQRRQAREQAATLFALAAVYAGGPIMPTLLLVGGMMGSGKSTLARAAGAELGWAIFSSDATRKRLARRDASQPDASGFGEGIYSRDWTGRTYAALMEEARGVLATGRSVILDATFSRRADRQSAAHVARELGARAVFVECVCADSVARARLAKRWGARVERRYADGGASAASDGRPELYEAQRAAWEPFDASAEAALVHVAVATDRPLTQSQATLLDALAIPYLACWLTPDPSA